VVEKLSLDGSDCLCAADWAVLCCALLCFAVLCCAVLCCALLCFAVLCCAAACQIVPNFRVRTIPVLGTAPAIFGMAAAAHILCELAGAPFSGEPMIQLTGQQYDRALSRLQQREEEVFSNTEGLPVDKDDVSFDISLNKACYTVPNEAFIGSPNRRLSPSPAFPGYTC
jgi:hypothetical protein